MSLRDENDRWFRDCNAVFWWNLTIMFIEENNLMINDKKKTTFFSYGAKCFSLFVHSPLLEREVPQVPSFAWHHESLSKKKPTCLPHYFQPPTLKTLFLCSLTTHKHNTHMLSLSFSPFLSNLTILTICTIFVTFLCITFSRTIGLLLPLLLIPPFFQENFSFLLKLDCFLLAS